MQRRSFLKLLAASSAAIAFPSIVRADTLGLNGKVAPSNRLALGFIGIGNQGGGHFHGELGDPLVQVVGLCDVDQLKVQAGKAAVETAYGAQKASGTYKGCFLTGDFRELIARPEIDAVWISVPDHWHALPVIHAAQAGKDIYAEKPLSLTIPEGQAMVSAVQDSGVVCQIGSQQRSSGEFQRAVQLARNGLLGKITRVQVGLPGGISVRGKRPVAPMAKQDVPATLDYNMWLGPAPYAPYYAERLDWNFRWCFDYSGGQLTDWIGHHFDIASWALDVTHTGPVAIKNASAVFATDPIYNTATDYSFEAHYANGTMFEVSSKNRSGVRIEGTDGWVYVTRGTIEFSDPELGRVAFPSTGFCLTPGSHTKNFLDCVQSRQTPICPIDQALRTVSVAHLANAAFRTGRSELQWDPDKQEVIDAPDAAALLQRAYRSPWQLPA
jgi:predicted dehydrogenase